MLSSLTSRCIYGLILIFVTSHALSNTEFTVSGSSWCKRGFYTGVGAYDYEADPLELFAVGVNDEFSKTLSFLKIND